MRVLTNVSCVFGFFGPFATSLSFADFKREEKWGLLMETAVLICSKASDDIKCNCKCIESSRLRFKLNKAIREVNNKW